ncbi:outer membrane beta-barrel protein [Nisaea acidiphila]|uniref:Outer membrane beta-barrel protein n=1 Tax=Nisaea acidiphila TaxID=1862145 RepID=A0A9J7AXE9_9PROT|nr:outer membrane beta-barrel protein [Nisaea acidiphila]UUX52055.1 outer membrane beta-barrel protein [Nisaea acidiphila]
MEFLRSWPSPGRRRALWLGGPVFAAILLAAFSGAAEAQLAGKESVMGRPRLDFQSFGLSLDLLTRPDDTSDMARVGGSFDLFPRATLDVGHDSNVLRTTDNEIESAFTEMKAEAALRSNWTNHEALLIVGVDDRRVADRSRENTTDVSLGAAARFDLDHDLFTRGFAEIKRGHIPRGDDADPGAGFEPLTFNQYLAGATFDDRQNDRLFSRFVGEVVHRSYNSTDGVSRDSLDRTSFNLRGLVGVSTGGEYDLFVSPSLLREVFVEDISEDQNSTRATVTVGAARDITGVSVFTGRVGVSHRIFDESDRDSQTDLVASGALLWNVTPVMTFSAGADIENQQSDDPTAGTKLVHGFNLGLDYDPVEQLILSGYLSYSNEDYQQTDREDDDYTVGLNATYFINEYLFAGLRFEHEVSDSTLASRDFEASTVAFRIGVKLCCRIDEGVVNPFNLGRL